MCVHVFPSFMLAFLIEISFAIILFIVNYAVKRKILLLMNSINLQVDQNCFIAFQVYVLFVKNFTVLL